MPEQHDEGTQAATLDTEHFLGTDPDGTDMTFVFEVNASALARGESLRIRLYKALLTGDTSSDVFFDTTILGAQAAPIFTCPPFMNIYRLRISIEQSGGTGRSFKWLITKV